MKKVLFTIFNLFFLISCHQEDIDVPSPEPTGEKVTISMSLRVPESKSANSRAFNDNGSNINTLYLAVFNEYNFLEQVVEATMLDYDPTKEDGYQEGTSYKPGTDEVCFQVELKQSSNKRTIHFIAYEEGTEDELTAQINSMNYGAESTLIGSLSVSNGKDAYWQKVEFPYGIRDNDVTKNLMRRVPLVRNFAKIVVTENDNDFWIERIAVVSPAKVGSVAPNFDGGFAVFTNGEDPLGYDDIKTSGYEGYTPGNDIDINNLGTIVNWDDQNNQASTYLYERNQNSNTAYLLIEGRWGSESASLSYYKLDLVNTEGIRYNLLRNFQYNVTITNVVGSGYGSPEEAINNPAGNNISGATETENFLNISDGTRQLFVTYTKRTLVSGNVVTDLKFKYLPNINNATTYGTAIVTAPAGDVLETAATVSSNHSDGWYTVTLDPKDPTAIPKIQEITISAGGLHRKIILTLREAYPLEVTCTSSIPVAYGTGKEVDINIIIPDDLPDYLFPLTFFVESKAMSLYPDASQKSLPVNNRKSVITDQTTMNTFGYDRELTLAEYNALKKSSINGTVVVPCYFLTNKAISSADNIYVYHELFNLAYTSYTMAEPVYVTKELTLTFTYGNNNATPNSKPTVTCSDLEFGTGNYRNGQCTLTFTYIKGTEKDIKFTFSYEVSGLFWSSTTYKSTVSIETLLNNQTVKLVED